MNPKDKLPIKPPIKQPNNRENISKLEQTSRNTSRTEHIEIRRDGPTVTRTRPGYVNPLRMNPPTPPGSRPGSPVDDRAMTSSVAESEKKDSGSQHSADHSDPTLDGKNKDIAEKLESTLHISDKEVEPSHSAADDGEKGEEGQATADDGPRDPEPSSDGIVHDMSKVGIDTENADSSATGHTEQSGSDAVGKESADTDGDTGEASKAGSEPAPSEDSTDDANPEQTANVDRIEEQTVGEDKSEGDSSVTDAKKPPKIKDSMYLDLGSSSNFHRMDEASKAEDDSIEKQSPYDSLSRLEEAGLGIKLSHGQRNLSYPSMAKVLKEGVSALRLAKDRKDSEGSRDSEDSKDSSPTFADLTDDSPLDYRIELARRYTNTYIEVLSPSDTQAPRRTNDDRVWYSRNLRCTSCMGNCPICDIECCVYKAAKDVLSKPKCLQSEMCGRLVEVIENLGSRVKDMSTFSFCTLDTGCGRRVCPSCCGVCPTEICRDVQCKECKPDPWAECDWHS